MSYLITLLCWCGIANGTIVMVSKSPLNGFMTLLMALMALLFWEELSKVQKREK